MRTGCAEAALARTSRIALHPRRRNGHLLQLGAGSDRGPQVAAAAAAADSRPTVAPGVACSGRPTSRVNVHGQAADQQWQGRPRGGSPARGHGCNAVVRVRGGGAAALERPRHASEHVAHVRDSSTVGVGGGGRSAGVHGGGARSADRAAPATSGARHRVGRPGQVNRGHDATAAARWPAATATATTVTAIATGATATTTAATARRSAAAWQPRPVRQGSAVARQLWPKWRGAATTSRIWATSRRAATPKRGGHILPAHTIRPLARVQHCKDRAQPQANALHPVGPSVEPHKPLAVYAQAAFITESVPCKGGGALNDTGARDGDRPIGGGGDDKAGRVRGSRHLGAHVDAGADFADRNKSRGGAQPSRPPAFRKGR